MLRVPFKKGSAEGHASHSLKHAMNGTTQQRLLLGMQAPKVHVRQQSQYPPPAGLVIDEQTSHRTNRGLYGSRTTWTQSCRRRDAILYCFSKYVSTDPNKREQRVFSSGRLRPACARADDAPPYAKGPTLHICTLMSTSCHRLTNPNVDCQKMNVSLSLLKINAELTHQTTITLRRPLRWSESCIGISQCFPQDSSLPQTNKKPPMLAMMPGAIAPSFQTIRNNRRPTLLSPSSSATSVKMLRTKGGWLEKARFE